MADPLGTFHHWLEAMGLTCTREDIAAAEDWIARNGRDTHPLHHYRLEDCGITAEDVDREFAFYHERLLD